MTASPHREWDGETEEGTLPRPGMKYPWIYAIQNDEGRRGFAWAVYSQHSPTPRWTGRAPSVIEARRAAEYATITNADHQPKASTP